MKNYMGQVAELLGVELDEEFKIEGCENVTRYKLTLDGMYYYSEYEKVWKSSCSIYYDILAGRREVIKLPKQVLTEKEKEYLTVMLKPFKESVVHIFKTDFHVKDGLEYLRIHIHDALDGAYYDISLPCFKKNTMYKNMELGKRYTLEELGLWLT